MAFLPKVNVPTVATPSIVKAPLIFPKSVPVLKFLPPAPPQGWAAIKSPSFTKEKVPTTIRGIRKMDLPEGTPMMIADGKAYKGNDRVEKFVPFVRYYVNPNTGTFYSRILYQVHYAWYEGDVRRTRVDKAEYWYKLTAKATVSTAGSGLPGGLGAGLASSGSSSTTTKGELPSLSKGTFPGTTTGIFPGSGKTAAPGTSRVIPGGFTPKFQEPDTGSSGGTPGGLAKPAGGGLGAGFSFGTPGTKSSGATDWSDPVGSQVVDQQYEYQDYPDYTVQEGPGFPQSVKLGILAILGGLTAYALTKDSSYNAPATIGGAALAAGSVYLLGPGGPMRS